MLNATCEPACKQTGFMEINHTGNTAELEQIGNATELETTAVNACGFSRDVGCIILPLFDAMPVSLPLHSSKTGAMLPLSLLHSLLGNNKCPELARSKDKLTEPGGSLSSKPPGPGKMSF